MNAIDVLKNDHLTVQKLFTEFLSADPGVVDREDLFQQIEKELLIHADVEEQIFYPAVHGQASELVQKALDEHHQMKVILSEMLEFEVDDEEFENRMNLLIDDVQHHIQEEEGPGGIIEVAARHLDETTLKDMGERIQGAKKSSEDELAA